MSIFGKFTGHECFVGGNRHNFKARSDHSVMRAFDKDGRGDLTLNTVFVFDDKYVQDVCTWCGKIIQRKEGKDGTNNSNRETD